jgi:NADH-quinone oxidoreductase subunit C
MSFLTTLCGIHYPFQKGAELGVVYHIHSLENNYRIRIKVWTSIDEPNIPSLTDLFASANWQERETFDFYGINFVGHPKMERILNMDEMTYHPLRKEFPLEDSTREDKADRFFGR